MAAPMLIAVGGRVGFSETKLQLTRWAKACTFCMKIHTSTQFSNKEAAVPESNVRAVFRTNETNPAMHSQRHEGQFYTICKDDVNKYFPVGFPQRFEKQLNTFNEAALMIRKPALEVIQSLQETTYENPPVRYVFYGKKGSGKTLSLAHVMHYCFTEGWLVVHVPSGFSFNRDKRWDYLVSSYSEGLVDKPVTGVEWLKHFRYRNEHVLAKLKTSNKYTWSRREETDVDQPLIQVIEQGINRPKNSCDAIGVVLKELHHQSGNGDFKMLVAVRGVNAFFGNITQLRRDDRTIVHVRELSLVKHFKKMLKNDWKNGAIVTTVDQHSSYKQPTQQHLPKYLLMKEGFEWMDPFLPIHVDKYSDKEAESCLDYYIDRLWLQHSAAKMESGRKELKFLSGNNPAELDRICGGL